MAKGAQAQASSSDASLAASICADRPTKTSNPCSVDPGHFQYEADVFNGAFQRQGGIATDTYLAASPTLKYGITASVDIEAQLALYETVNTRDRGGPERGLSGIGDLYVRLKYAAYGGGDDKLQVALEPFLKAPTARRGIGNGKVEGGVQIPIAYKITDTLSFGATPEFDANADQIGAGSHLYTAQTASLGLGLAHAVTIYAELASSWDFDPAATTRQFSADVAISWVAAKALQLDAGMNFGLNPATPRVQLYAGISQKF